MAKRKRTIIAGQMVRTVVYTAPEPQDSKRTRAEKSRMTTAAQRSMNDKAARVRLEMLVAANFTMEDLFVTLTYRDADLPTNRTQAAAVLRGFLKLIRGHRRRLGQAVKYVYTTEEKHGQGRVHHHLILNATGGDIEVIRSLWAHGDVVDVEYIGQRDYETLALYMTKEGVEGRPVGSQMWTRSRNLITPLVYSSYVSNDTTVSPPPGCHVIENEAKVTEFGNYSYLKYQAKPHQIEQLKRDMEAEKIRQ